MNANYALDEQTTAEFANFSVRFTRIDSTMPNYWHSGLNSSTILDQTLFSAFARTSQRLRAATEPGTTATGVYYLWSKDNWDFGTPEQYPTLKYTAATDILGSSACLSAADSAADPTSRLPVCGTLIAPKTRYGLSALTARYAQLTEPFDDTLLDIGGAYRTTVLNDTPRVQLVATTREATATYSVYVGDTPISENINSDAPSGVIPLNADGTTEVVIVVHGTRTVRYTVYLDYRFETPIDADNDGLVDLHYLEDVAMVRFNFQKEIGYRTARDGELDTVGCPNGVCRGYELMRDLDFDDPASYREPATNRPIWTTRRWEFVDLSNAVFKGNGYAISNLSVLDASDLIALFAIVSDSDIDGLGLVNVDINSTIAVAMAASLTRSTIRNSYVIGDLSGEDVAPFSAFFAKSSLSNSYFIGTLRSSIRFVPEQPAFVHGLVLSNYSDSIGSESIENSRAIGRIETTIENELINTAMLGANLDRSLNIGNSYASMLMTRVGVAQGNLSNSLGVVTNSYFDRDIAGVDVPASRARSGAELRATTMTGIFAAWDADDWDFGGAGQSPVIKYNSDECQRARHDNPLCGKILPYQGSLMKRFELLDNAGLSRPFDFATFNDYEIVVGADQQGLRFVAEAFAPNADIVVYKTTTDTEVLRVKSGTDTPLIALDTGGDTLLDVVVEEGEDRKSYRYRFSVSRLNEPIDLAAIDGDNDGLIDVATPEQLNAMRHSLDGRFYRAGGTSNSTRIYCRSGCRGYELTADIDLAGIDWQPIGRNNARFDAHFKGNGYVISNLTLHDPAFDGIGMFAYLGENARLEDIHLKDVSIRSSRATGAIAALAVYNYGTIFNSRVENAAILLQNGSVGALVYQNLGRIINSGAVGGTIDNQGAAAGLVHTNDGAILGSFATIAIRSRGSNTAAAGLSLENNISGNIENSYAQPIISDNTGAIAGLIDTNEGAVNNSYATGGPLVRTASGSPQILDSYWDRDTAAPGATAAGGTSKTTVALQSGVAQNNSTDTVYYRWDSALWHFGNADQYPAALYQDGSAGLCTQPTAEQLQSCAMLVSPGLSEADRAVVCRDRLLRDRADAPYCGTLVPYQDRRGLIALELPAGAMLVPEFSPEVESYNLMTDEAVTVFHTTPTAYYRTDTVTLIAGDSEQIIADNTRSAEIDLNRTDTDAVRLAVRSATDATTRSYTIRFRSTDYQDNIDIRLSALDGSRLSPNFARDRSDYRLIVYSDTERVRLNTAVRDPLPGAVVDIVITADNGLQPITLQDRGIAEVLLNDGASEITVAVNGGHRYRFEYRIAVERLPFASYRGILTVDDDNNIVADADRDLTLDTDGDGLIEIAFLEQLDTIRHGLDGRGFSYQSETTTTTIEIDSGCPDSGCFGYELVRDLDFNDDNSYVDAQRSMPLWTEGKGWQPIGDADAPFTAQFIADGHTISGLMIRRHTTDDVGLFGAISTATIRGINVSAAEVIGDNDVGILVGEDRNNSDIINSRATGTVRADNNGGGLIGVYRGNIVNSGAGVSVQVNAIGGGLIGRVLRGAIDKSRASGTVSARSGSGGGLVGAVENATISNSYATATIDASEGGGLVGSLGTGVRIDNSYAIGANRSARSSGLVFNAANVPVAVNDSYWDVNTSGVVNGRDGTSQTTVELQSATTAIYTNWNTEIWDLGNNMQYPRLKYTTATDTLFIDRAPTCRVASDTSSRLPVCGELLRGQYIGLTDLTFSSEVLELIPSFNPQIYNYSLVLKADETGFQLTPTYVGAAYGLSVDGGIAEVVRSGSASLRIPVAASGSTGINLGNGDLVYTFTALRHPYLRVDDLDVDDDGLIEIYNRTELDAVRYQPDGSGYRSSAADQRITVGCAPTTGCIGYELAASIELSAADWESIGTLDCDNSENGCFTGIFEGNRSSGYTISGLRIAAPNTDNVGLFAHLHADAEIRNLVLSGVSVTGRDGVGGLAGNSKRSRRQCVVKR